MSYPIEIICLGEDVYPHIERAAKTLNTVQSEFRFFTPSPALKQVGLTFVFDEYHTKAVFEFLQKYRQQARGYRPFLIAVVNRKLRSEQLGNLFGSHEAENGLAVVTLQDQSRYVDLPHKFLCYYLIRYCLSFVAPQLKAHEETKSCFFDKKLNKADLLKSLATASLCDACLSAFQNTANTDVMEAFKNMGEALKRLPNLDGRLVWLHLSDLHMCPAKTGWDASGVSEH